MNRIVITDNCNGKSFYELGITSEAASDLRKIADTKIGQLRIDEHSQILVFPPDYGVYGDKLERNVICSIKDDTLTTGNVMGFVGIGNTSLTIRSRFTPTTKQDYFLYYMLCRVLSINVFDLNHSFEQISILEFLIYLFPVYLEDALMQGIYKEYIQNEHDNLKVRGTVDIARQIKKHLPFNGKIAYNVRDYSYDNRITQLIRHTIEYIEQHPFAGDILSKNIDIRSAVSLIKEVTPTYNKYLLQEIINENIHPLTHPYYTIYADLQRLCLGILQKENLMYGEDESKIYGILFDGAWLWEEYLNTTLSPLGLKHPQNKLSRDGIRPFIHGKRTFYPDFYKTQQLVIDAKYKFISGSGESDDLHQIVCYMHILYAKVGAFIYPSANPCFLHSLGELNGLGGNVFKYEFQIPQHADTMQEFCKLIEQSEKSLKECILKILT